MFIEIVNAWNLIGDTLYSIGPLQQYVTTRENVAVAFPRNLGGQAGYIQLGKYCPVFFCEEHENLEETFPGVKVLRLDVQKAFCSGKYITEGYSQQLGVQWNGDKRIPCDWVDISLEASRQLRDKLKQPKKYNVIAVAPFSYSGRDTKAFNHAEIRRIVERIRQLDATPVIIGNEPYEGLPLFQADSVVDFAAYATGIRQIVTCDNGISHLASMLGVQALVVFKPYGSKNFISPDWGKNTTVVDSVEIGINFIGRRAHMRTPNHMIVQDTPKLHSTLKTAIESFCPLNVIETGTHLGTGTTQVLLHALAGAARGAAHIKAFTTIEVHPQCYAQAVRTLAEHHIVKCVNGLSVGLADAITATIDDAFLRDPPDDVAMDTPDPRGYLEELHGGNMKNTILDKLLEQMLPVERPLFCLDSAGSVGWLEYSEVCRLQPGPFLLFLDDVNHVKHHRSRADILAHPELWKVHGEDMIDGWMIAEHVA